jgi:hypothetical protein
MGGKVVIGPILEEGERPSLGRAIFFWDSITPRGEAESG